MKSTIFSLPLTTIVNVAAANTVQGGTSVLGTGDGNSVTDAKQDIGETKGRVVVAGDSTTWGGCRAYDLANKPFNAALFSWISG